MGDDVQVPLDQAKLEAVRKLLPSVEFIRSTRPMSDEIDIEDLLSALSCDVPSAKSYYPFTLAQEALTFLTGLVFSAGKALSNKATSAKQKEIKKSSSDSTETSV